MIKIFLTAITVSLTMFPVSISADIGTNIKQHKGNQPLYSKASVTRFYEQHQNAPQWSEKQIDELLQAIEASNQHGLIPSDYHLSTLKTNNEDTERRDIIATDAYLTLAGHLLGGKLNPVSLEPTWTAKGRSKDLVVHLADAIRENKIVASLDTLAPQQPRYQIMKKALAKYQDVVRQGGWPVVPEGASLKPGMESPRIPVLRERLAATGDIHTINIESTMYDESLVEAVKGFQKRANLEPDGIIGPSTLRKLNRSPMDRINQIRINMERWRWLPEDFGQQHIRVNIADYRLEAHEGNDIAEVHDVVVGRTYRQTPVFSANMSYLVLNPWWETPSSLARKDLLPKFQKKPKLVQELGYQVLNQDGKVVDGTAINWNKYSASSFPFRIRQKPGEKNALGKVKFMFPNQHNVYLHDTSTPELFGKTRRDFSSGCIRVRNPIELVEWSLEHNQDWPRSRIDASLETGKEMRVNLKQHIPVHLLYWTVVVDDMAGNIRFIDDIYERDNKVLAMLDQRPAGE